MLIAESIQTQRNQRDFTFSLTLKAGEIGVLLGRSGSGKSTLLEMLAGFVPIQHGKLTYQDRLLNQQEPQQRPFTMLFQQHNLFEHLTVQQNIGLGLNPSLKLSATQLEQLYTAASKLQIAELLTRTPPSLSGGQQQRVALARCLVRQQPFLLLDEPFSALDPALRIEMFRLVRTLADEQKIGVLLVSHQPNEARDFADWFGFVDKGKLQFTASMTQLEHHSSPALAAYLGTTL